MYVLGARDAKRLFFQFLWMTWIAPAFFIPICICAFLTTAPLTNVAFWTSYCGLLSCICVQAARKRNNRYLLIPFILFKSLQFAFIIFIAMVHFFILTHTVIPPSINHQRELHEIFMSYLHFVIVSSMHRIIISSCVIVVLVALLNSYLVLANIAFLYLSLTIVYDIEYVRHFDAEINIEQQMAGRRERRLVERAENADEI
ncbi:unnamed protein product [Toxocara canis]|uniref:Uncharacterized protein n=1 Tax=Toxocara canis TaxID=6265 RepID=A0A183TXE3_TOXCA|nr:unnamed protein product [Toxocara canis]